MHSIPSQNRDSHAETNLKQKAAEFISASQQSLSYFHSSLILLLALFVPLFLLRLFLLAQQHIPGHDTLAQSFLQYLLFNEALIKGAMPHWVPFMAHGTVYDFGFLSSQGILLPAIYPVAPLLKNINFLYILQASFLIDEFALLLGCFLLARRYFQTLATTIFICSSLTYTAITAFQPHLDFHIVYLLPMILYCLDRAFEDTSAKYLFLSGLFSEVLFLSNLAYIVPFIWFAICIFYLMKFCFMPREFLATLKQFWFYISWRHLLATLILVGLFITIGLSLWNATEEVFIASRNETETGTVPVETFLTYGDRYIGLSKYTALFSRYPRDFNSTIYAGILILPFVSLAVFKVRSRESYIFGTTALLLMFFGAGTIVSLIFYYLFPLGTFFRYIGLTAQVAKFFLVFYAGFGFEVFWSNLRTTSYENKHELTEVKQDSVILLIPAIVLGILFIVLLGARLDWYALYDGSPYTFWFARVEFPNYFTLPLLLTAAFLLLLVAAFYWPKQTIMIGSLLLIIHVFDVLLLKIEMEYNRTVKVDKEIVDLFNPHEYQFTMKRTQDYSISSRSTPLAPLLLENNLVEGGMQPSAAGGRYGALYNVLDAFLFLDLPTSAFRTDVWLEGVERFHQIWLSAPERVSRRLAYPIPTSAVYRKLTGFDFPKLQLFSKIHILQTDTHVSQALAGDDFTGDIIFGSNDDPALSQLKASPALVLNNQANYRANERMTTAEVVVVDFSFNSLHLKIYNPSAQDSILYYADGWHSDWQVFIDGEPTPIIKANLAYKAVIVPSGQSEVLFEFGKWKRLWLFKGIQLLGILTLVGVFYLVVDLRQ